MKIFLKLSMLTGSVGDSGSPGAVGPAGQKGEPGNTFKFFVLNFEIIIFNMNRQTRFSWN